MPSPFPGMDPYIEACGLWEDFHQKLATKIYEQLAPLAPENYLIFVAQREYVVLVEPEGKKGHPFVPDVSVTAGRGRKKSPRSGAAVAEAPADDSPVTMCAFVEEAHREAFVEIRENAPGRRLVTAIEILSPSNKQPKSTGRDTYLRKRQSLMLEGVHFLEIDLLLGGEKMPMADGYPPNFLYTLLLARSKKADLCQVWPAHFARPIPPVPVPLLKGDADLSLRLQPLIDSIHTLTRYDQIIDYSTSLPSAPEGEAAAVRRLLGARRS